MGEKDKENDDYAKNGDGVKAPAQASDNSAELKDRLLRLAAEFDNYKKRVAKDLEGAEEVGRSEVISRLLPTLDEFELALGAFGKDDARLKGMELIFSNLISTLKGLGLNEIDVEGKFDPYRHEIVLARESDRPEGEILEVMRKGYMLNNIMLRPASVIISKAGSVKDEQKGE